MLVVSVRCGTERDFCLVVHHSCDAGTNTYPWLCSQFLFCQIDTREDANIDKANACEYLSNSICTVVKEWHHGYFCFGDFSVLDTLLPRDAVGPEGVAEVCSGFCARSWVSWRKLQRSPGEHWPFSFHW